MISLWITHKVLINGWVIIIVKRSSSVTITNLTKNAHKQINIYKTLYCGANKRLYASDSIDCKFLPVVLKKKLEYFEIICFLEYIKAIIVDK